jgi:hypothetical protein
MEQKVLRYMDYQMHLEIRTQEFKQDIHRIWRMCRFPVSNTYRECVFCSRHLERAGEQYYFWLATTSPSFVCLECCNQYEWHKYLFKTYNSWSIFPNTDVHTNVC